MKGGSQADFDTLIELITSTVRPQTWSEMGGPGTITGFDTNLSLVISQTQEVHEEIADLLVPKVWPPDAANAAAVDNFIKPMIISHGSDLSWSRAVLPVPSVPPTPDEVTAILARATTTLQRV